MADFRKLLYAIAVVALMAGLSVPAAAQSTPMTCTANAGVPPTVRAEGFAELVGDIVLICTGGTPTAKGLVVQPVNFTVFLTTNITSNPLSGIFNEALLIIDEPNSAVNPGRPILNCGASGAPDRQPNGDPNPGVCSITSTGNPDETYDGTPQGYVDGPDDGDVNDICGSTPGAPAASMTGCGRPNVFQGRQGVPQAVNQANAVTFNGVPLDPPGDGKFRIIRITNLRADAQRIGASQTFNTVPITASISVSGTTSLAINNPQQTVAFILKGLQDVSVVGTADYVQCLEEVRPSLTGIDSKAYDLTVLPSNRRVYVRYREGFANSWKTKGWEQMQANGTLPNVGQSYRYYDIGTKPTNYPTTVVRQNVPGAIYNTESGFNSPPSSYPAADPSDQNPPIGVGSVAVSGGGVLQDNYDANEGISGAGIANQGTRLVLSFQSGIIPAGATAYVPAVVLLTRDGVNAVTGVAVRTTTTDVGAGAFVAFTGGTTTWTSVSSSGIAVYEILFTDPFSIEAMTVPVALEYTPNLSSNNPRPGAVSNVAAGFAPFYDRNPPSPLPSATLPEPRFVPTTVIPDRELFRINKCACNLLFPYVTNARAGNAAFDTGIALANTSKDPGVTPYGFTAVPQEGAVRFWYYNTAPPDGAAAAPLPQCTNTADPGGQNGTVCNTKVPAGAVLTYVLSKGSSQWGLDPRAANFTGYMIAQAEFQYCHAFAYISAQDAGPTTPGMSVGYLALVLDKGYELGRTSQTLSDNLSH